MPFMFCLLCVFVSVVYIYICYIHVICYFKKYILEFFSRIHMSKWNRSYP